MLSLSHQYGHGEGNQFAGQGAVDESQVVEESIVAGTTFNTLHKVTGREVGVQPMYPGALRREKILKIATPNTLIVLPPSPEFIYHFNALKQTNHTPH